MSLFLPFSLRPPSSRDSRLAFTLVEMLIVVAILVLLAAILFPVFASVREKARRATCQSNLKQIGLAMLQYTQDYDERYPSTYLGFDRELYSVWKHLLPYTKSEQIFYCPSDTANTQCDWSCTSIGKEITYGFNVGPAWNESFEGAKWGGIYSEFTYHRDADGIAFTLLKGASVAEVVSAEQTFVATDGYDIWWGSMDPTAFFQPPMPETNSAWRHHNWRNALFADGHVKSIKWRSGFNTNNTDAWNVNLMLPENPYYYQSYCLDPDKEINFPNRELTRCGDVAARVAAGATSWMTD